MKITSLAIADIKVLEPHVFADERGYFFESFHQDAFERATGVNTGFVQDNHSQSQQGVLRGLHYQLPPMAQGKLIRVIEGEVFDVAVDIRRKSPTFGQWVGVNLSATNRKQLWIPAGFAHGFMVLSAQAQCLYKTTHYYSAAHERCIAWDDPSLAIDWPLAQVLSNNQLPLLSKKDELGKLLTEAELFDN